MGQLKEARNRELIAEWRARPSGLDDEARLDLLGEGKRLPQESCS